LDEKMIKKIILLIGLIFFLFGYSQVDELVGYWLFGEVEGGITIDANNKHIKCWNPLKWTCNPANWDPKGKMSLIKIPEIDKTAMQMITETKAMHMYSSGWPVKAGDKCIIKALVKGKGKGALGIYLYLKKGATGFIEKEFTAEDSWKEVVREIEIKKPNASHVAIVIVVKSASSIEFTDVTAELRK